MNTLIDPRAFGFFQQVGEVVRQSAGLEVAVEGERLRVQVLRDDVIRLSMG